METTDKPAKRRLDIAQDDLHIHTNNKTGFSLWSPSTGPAYSTATTFNTHYKHKQSVIRFANLHLTTGFSPPLLPLSHPL